VTQTEADRYIRQAVMQSSEGVILLPATRSEADYDRVRLDEIAHAMRQPLAVCFLERAIATMERTRTDGEESYAGVPEGQGKFRARVGADGSVVRVEVLESGFSDPNMEQCTMEVIAARKFPQLRGQSQTYIDVVYWVSLGLHAQARSPQFQQHLRREQTRAAVRARRCLEGRVSPGTYEVEGLSLFGRDGGTLINRVDRGGLSPEVSRCLAQAFKQIRIAPEQDSFVRAAAPVARFTVREDGTVEVEDEEWLRLIELEERAGREERRRQLGLEGGTTDGASARKTATVRSPHDVTISGLEPLPDEDPAAAAPADSPEPPPPDPDAPSSPARDPGRGGIKLDLGPRR
jgi:hypothetical protein